MAETRVVVVAGGVGRHLTFWLAILAFAIAAIWLLSDILLPFVAGAVLAYLFNPLVHRLQALGLNRLIASLLIIGAFVLAFVALLLLVVPLLATQLGELAHNLPGYVRRLQAVIAEANLPWLRRLLGEQGTSDTTMGDVVGQSAGWLTAFLKSVWSGGRALISVLSLVVVTPVVAFYLLSDWDRMIAAVDSWVPLRQRETVRGLAREIDVAIAGFIRGQTAVCLILGTFYALGLTLVGLNFGFLIGLVAGLISFIPYIGSMSGLVVSASVAVAQFWPAWTPILLVLSVFFVGQFLEGYVLSPKLVGKSVGLHPVWLMFALFAFGYLFGFVGLLLAVPLAAAVGVLTRFALRRYRESPLYTGQAAAPQRLERIDP
ncbi:MAG TPA: AI-2E family transporter [Xanthobacteraceae bacterium]